MSGFGGGILFLVIFALVAAGGLSRGRFFTLAWRWLSGQHLSGELITDAGWSIPGTKAFTQTGRARRWWYRPRRYRAAWRTSGTVAVLGALYGLLFAPAVTLAVLGALGVVLVTGGGVMAVSWWRGRVHRRQWVEPVHLVAAPLVGLPLATDPYEWLTVSRDRRRVVIMLPPSWRGLAEERARLVDVVSTRLALDSPEVRYALQGPRPRLELVQSVPPPALVTLGDAAPALERARDDELVWGIGRRLAVVKTSLSGDSPHVGLSMGSGAGKSVTARSLLAQQLHRGAVGLVLDCKMISHQWAANLPNVVVFRRPAEIHAALCWLGAEVNRRNEVALAGADADGEIHADVGPRIFVVFEEMNAAVAQLRSYWQEIRTRDDPKRSPALSALDLVSFTGRQARTNILYIAQRMSDKATGGGGDARENIGVIAFGRWRASTWKMLAPDFPVPAKNLTPGRVQVVSDSVRECQGILMSPAEARGLALSGTVSPLPSTMPGAAVTVSQLAVDSGSDVGLSHVTGPPVPPPVTAPVTLREAAAALGLSLSAARQRRQRDPSFPAPVGTDGQAELYDLADLSAYAGRG